MEEGEAKRWTEARLWGRGGGRGGGRNVGPAAGCPLRGHHRTMASGPEEAGLQDEGCWDAVSGITPRCRRGRVQEEPGPCPGDTGGGLLRALGASPAVPLRARVVWSHRLFALLRCLPPVSAASLLTSPGSPEGSVGSHSNQVLSPISCQPLRTSRARGVLGEALLLHFHQEKAEPEGGVFACGDSGSEWKIRIRAQVFPTFKPLPLLPQSAALVSGRRGTPSKALHLGQMDACHQLRDVKGGAELRFPEGWSDAGFSKMHSSVSCSLKVLREEELAVRPTGETARTQPPWWRLAMWLRL